MCHVLLGVVRCLLLLVLSGYDVCCLFCLCSLLLVVVWWLKRCVGVFVDVACWLLVVV